MSFLEYQGSARLLRQCKGIFLTGVVDDNVQPTKRSSAVLEGFLPRLATCDIGMNEVKITVCFGPLFALLFVEVNHDYSVTLLAEAINHRSSKAIRSALFPAMLV
jgi:hypothetical protein